MRPAPALIAGVLLLAAIGLAVAFGLWSRSALISWVALRVGSSRLRSYSSPL